MNGRITNIFEIQMFFGKEAFQRQWFLLFIFTCLCPLSCLSFNYFHLDSFLTNPKSMPTSFCFFPLCLHEKSVMFPILDSTCRYPFDKCRLETKKRWLDTLEIEDFSSSNPRTCSSPRESSIWSLEIADRVGREILLV